MSSIFTTIFELFFYIARTMPMGPLDYIVAYTSRSLRGPTGMVLA
jgi:hypothetical protein